MKTRFPKVVAIALCLCMLLSLVPMTALAAVEYTPHDSYYNVISKDDYDLAPGITESEIVLNNDDGSHRQVAHVVEIDINNPYTKVMPSYKGMHQGLDSKNYGVQVMSQQAAYAEANGYGNVVAAMNLSLSWYNTAYYAEHPELVGEPLGYLVMDGKLYVNSAGQTAGAQTCLVINYDEKDGVARPADMPKTEIRATSSAITGWEEQVIPANFGFLVKDGKNQYAENHTSDPASRSFVGIKADGTIVMVMNDGRQSPYSAGFNSYEMAEFMLSLGCVQAVNGDGGGSSTFLSQRPGEELKLNCSPSDGAERATTHGILVISTAPATGEFVRAQITTEDKYYTPGAVVQFNAIGTDLVGTPADIPADATWKLTDSAMGTIDNNGLFTSNGTTGEVTAQMVWGGEVVGEAAINIVIPDISFKQDTLVLPYGEAAELSLNITTNEGLNTVTTKPGDIVFTLSDAAMGTIDGNIFSTTADTTVTGGTLTAVICGDTDNAITATVKFGKASDIVINFENNYELIIDNSLTGGDEDADTTKEYYYGWHMGDIRIDQYYGFRWTAKKSYPTSIGVQMGKDLYMVDKTTGMVRNGENALAVNMDWSSVTSMGSKQMNVWFPEPIDVSEATSAGMWIYITDVETVKNSLSFRWTGFKKDGSATSVTTAFSKLLANCGFTDEGWLYVSCDTVANNLATIEYFQIMANDASAAYTNPMADYTFYIDDVTVDYSDATIDRENPYFSSVTISNGDTDVDLTDGYVVSGNTVTLFAQAKENTTKNNYTGLNASSVKVTVDGKVVTNGVAVTAGGKISVVDLALSTGVHTIRFEICDGQGNTGSITRKLVVGSEVGDVRFELANPGAMLPAGSIMYLNLVANDITTIDSVTTKIRLDGCNDWDLAGLEVAYGFEASYTINANNDVVITITRVSNAVAADTNVLAKLPVRIWMTSTYLNEEYIALGYVKDDPALQDKYYALTPYAMWLSDGVSIIRVIMDACEGVVSYTNGEVSTFSSEKFDLETELNRYRNSKNDGDANFYQNKASFHIHTPVAVTDKAATCTEAGYTGRIVCGGCSCATVEKYGHQCDTHSGCGSVIDWGTIVPATGHSFDESVDGIHTCTDCGNVYYYVGGEAQTGWAEVDGKVYYFGVDGIAVNGEATVDGVIYTFADYVLTAPALVSDGIGLVGYWAGEQLAGGWHTINGKQYYVTGIYVNTGITKIGLGTDIGMRYHIFDENGVFQSDYTGIIEYNGALHFAKNGACAYKGLQVDNEGNYYYINRKYLVITNTYYTLNDAMTNGLVKAGDYYFGADGKMVIEEQPDEPEVPEVPVVKNGLVKDEDGEIRYYVNDVATYAGVVQDAEGNYYYINSSKKAVKNTTYYIYAGRTNGLLPEGSYKIAADGKLIVAKNGLSVDADGEIRYYENDVAIYAGLVQDADGNYYYINSSKKAVKNTTYYIYAGRTNGLLPEGSYKIGADGKLILPKEGLVKDADGEIRYYENDVAIYAGLVQDADGNYYYINSSKKAVKNTTYYIYAGRTNGLLSEGTYTFDADGKMIVE